MYAFIVLALLSSLLDLHLLVGLEQLSFHGAFALKLLTHVVEGILNWLTSVSGSNTSGARAFREDIFLRLAALSSLTHNLITLLVKLSIKHVDLMNAENWLISLILRARSVWSRLVDKLLLTLLH